MTDANLDERLALLEQTALPRHNDYDRRFLPIQEPALPPVGTWQRVKIDRDASVARERRAAAKAEDARARAELERRAEEARLAEEERQRLWLAHAPQRERALRDLEALDIKIAELDRQQIALREIAQRYGRPAGHFRTLIIGG